MHDNASVCPYKTLSRARLSCHTVSYIVMKNLLCVITFLLCKCASEASGICILILSNVVNFSVSDWRASSILLSVLAKDITDAMQSLVRWHRWYWRARRAGRH